MRRLLIGLVLSLGLGLPLAAHGQTPPEGGYTGPLFPAGEPRVATGDIGKDQPFLTVPARFSFTGVLQEPVDPAGWFDTSTPLPAGQPMFAIILGSGYGANSKSQVIWCTTRKAPRKNQPNRWQTICLPEQVGLTHRWVESYSLLPFRLEFSNSTPALRAPVVKQGPADFGVPIILSYRVLEFDSKDLDVNLYMSIDGYETWIGQTNIPRQADGSAVLPILGGAIRLTQIGKDRKSARAEVIAPLSAASPNLLAPIR